MEHKTLAEAVAAASKIVGGRLAPDKTNLEQRYDYLSADLILSVCGQALADCGVAVFPAILDENLTLVERPNKSPRLDVKVTMSFDVSNTTQSKAYDWVGRGSDWGSPDKAMYKAITSGHKYFLMKLLNVGAGNEDGEHEGEDAPPEPVRPPARPVAAPDTQPEPFKEDCIAWMEAEGLADNVYNARAIWDKLGLSESMGKSHAFDRIKLYRSWRNSGATVPVAAEHAIAGNAIDNS